MNNAEELLRYIPPDDYDVWMKVGAALKAENEPFETFDTWSRGSSKYKSSEDCRRKWDSFKRGKGSDSVEGGTIYHLACEYGYQPYSKETLDIDNLWLNEATIDKSFVSPEPVPKAGSSYNAKGEMLEYLKALFKPDEFVGINTAFEKDEETGKWKPEGRGQRRTAGNIIEELETGTIESALGTLNKEAGVYIRFNPLDGKGEGNQNVTRWNYCLIESDKDSLEKQYALLKKFNFPIKFIVNSGGKSLHAIVKVDAENEGQYQERVKNLYAYCKTNGFALDEQDKNSSRYSRLPGVKRGDNWQYIVARDIGAKNYTEWEDWAFSQADDLPDDEGLDDLLKNKPPLNDELIPGILREGHKLLLAGPSKAGKSFLLMNLCISIAEGVDWIGHKCKQGKVLYVNLELDRASCIDRFDKIYKKLGIERKHTNNLRVWNLRGMSEPLDKLTPKMIRRYKESGLAAVVIDPIYKVITGDENNATEMSRFCHFFDKIAFELNAAVIYCHHHSKGAQDKYGSAMDRSSGSGVFARDPDAILDLVELTCKSEPEKYTAQYPDACDTLTAWELAGTLREFAPMKPERLWFDYPIHRMDEYNFLSMAKIRSSQSGEAKTTKIEAMLRDAEEMMALNDRNAVSAAELGIKSIPNGRLPGGWRRAKVDGIELLTKADYRKHEEIIYNGNIYKKASESNSSPWIKAGAVNEQAEL